MLPRLRRCLSPIAPVATHNFRAAPTNLRRDTTRLLGHTARMNDTDDPIALFQTWFAEARKTETDDATAMALATAAPDGRPAVRMVLLKGVDARGFVFYTHSTSPKGHDLAANLAGVERRWCGAPLPHDAVPARAATIRSSGGDPAGGALVTMAVDPTAASIANSASAQGLTLATITAPGSSVTSLTYSAPSVAGSGILLGDIPAGYCKFLILKRAGNNSEAISETINLAITGSTLA